MQYVMLFLPVLFSAGAQIFIKQAAKFDLKTTNWFIFVGLSLACYVIAFAVYSFTVRLFPISIASPVNTISVMVIVVIFGLVVGEILTVRQLIGVGFGLASILLLLIK